MAKDEGSRIKIMDLKKIGTLTQDNRPNDPDYSLYRLIFELECLHEGAVEALRELTAGKHRTVCEVSQVPPVGQDMPASAQDHLLLLNGKHLREAQRWTTKMRGEMERVTQHMDDLAANMDYNNYQILKMSQARKGTKEDPT